MDVHRSGGIAWQLAFGDGDAIGHSPLLAAHVEKAERDAGKVAAAFRDEVVELVKPADGIEGGIALRRIA